MKTTVLLVTTAILLAISIPAFAQEFPDVPPDHWAYDAVQELVNVGIVQGYPDGTFHGKRAMTRYEFAEALAKSIPAIEEIVRAGISVEGIPGPAGPAGPAGEQGPPGAGAEQVEALQNLVDEFRDELAALGVDVEALRRDVAALNERLTAVEDEIGRVRFTGEASVIARGEVRNSAIALDKDGRLLSVFAIPGQEDNPLANSSVFVDLDVNMAARVSDNIQLNALINAGDYSTFATTPWGGFTMVDDFTLWHMYADAAVDMGPFGPAQAVIGRFPMQLTPFTLNSVDPDWYSDVTRLDSGDYVMDGGSLTFNWGNIALTTFAGQTQPIADLISPDLQLGGFSGAEVAQLAGARAVIGTSAVGNLGLTYYQAGTTDPARADIWGADINTNIGSVGLAAEWAQSEPNNALQTVYGITANDNTAWNAELSWQTGNLGLTGGYTRVEAHYFAPGYWNRVGTLTNPVNVKGPTAGLTYAVTPRLNLTAEGQFLQPVDNALLVSGRTATIQGPAVAILGSAMDTLNYWSAGLSFDVNANSTIGVEWEQATYDPVVGNDVEDRFVTLCIGHNFNPNASLKLLYQITELQVSPAVNYRGGVAAAQFSCVY